MASKTQTCETRTCKTRSSKARFCFCLIGHHKLVFNEIPTDCNIFIFRNKIFGVHFGLIIDSRLQFTQEE